MIKRYKRINKKSAKGKLREKIGALHLKILHFRNNGQCQICGRYSNTLGRFHILEVSTYPNLEYHDQNVLLAGWYCCHEAWHHYGPDHPKVRVIKANVMRLRGANYHDELRIISLTAPALKGLQLELVYEAKKQEYKALGGL